MTATLAAQSDPYILPLPSPDSPVVLSHWISPGNTHPNSRYQDPVWSLAPLIDDPSISLYKLRWTSCPAPLREQMKRAVWTMINGELRPTSVSVRKNAARTRASIRGMHTTWLEWMRLARWLHAHGVTTLHSCTAAEWRAYASQRWDELLSRTSAERVCRNLTNLWAFDQLSTCPSGITRPPWDSEGIDDFLPAADGRGGGENVREPLGPEALSPLLIWSIRFVDDFADDILAAWTERRRLAALAAANNANQAGQDALEDLLLPLIQSRAPLPATRYQGRFTLARAYVAALTGASLDQTDEFSKRHGLASLAAERPGPCPLEVPVTGRVEGKLWRGHLDFYEAADLMRHLGTAATIICLYLTGMRPQEIQSLRSGCCPDPGRSPDGSPGRHLIRSRHYKNVADEDGNYISGGEERNVPWVAITPVVHAIRVLERMVPKGELLLGAAHHDFNQQRGFHGTLKSVTLNKRIESFVAWVNHHSMAQGLTGQSIPADPHGPIAVARFRRSLAWHIARRPGGLVALAIQYGHMRTVLDARISSGYGSRSRNGIHSVLDVETALAAADTAALLRDRVAGGEKISGPAARRALTAAATTPRFEGRIVPGTFAKKAAQFLARDGLVLYDNPDAFLICAFKHDNALCAPDPGATAPRQYACQPGCGNTVRTDAHARQLQERADDIDKLAAHAPGPVGKRMRTNAHRLRETAAAHHATAQTLT
ncbi:integrase [Streptomyces sp. 24-1644]|uniref:integrase n=1 Tax=Streptomyces sp. 24-1644 TaxID=3457315 RepID=UPI003FA77AE4